MTRQTEHISQTYAHFTAHTVQHNLQSTPQAPAHTKQHVTLSCMWLPLHSPVDGKAKSDAVLRQVKM